MSLKTESKKTNAKMAIYLKEERQAAKLTMRALADIIETPHSFIGKIEQKSRRMDVGEFIQYCKAMGKDPVEAFKDVVDL